MNHAPPTRGPSATSNPRGIFSAGGCVEKMVEFLLANPAVNGILHEGQIREKAVQPSCLPQHHSYNSSPPRRLSNCSNPHNAPILLIGRERGRKATKQQVLCRSARTTSAGPIQVITRGSQVRILFGQVTDA